MLFDDIFDHLVANKYHKIPRPFFITHWAQKEKSVATVILQSEDIEVFQMPSISPTQYVIC